MSFLVLRALQHWGGQKLVVETLVQAVECLASVDRSAVDWDSVDRLLEGAIHQHGLDRTWYKRAMVTERLRCVSTM